MTNNTTGNNNTGVGAVSLGNNTGGHNNTGLGYSSLASNTLGTNNTGIGRSSLQGSTNGDYNTAVGYGALITQTSNGYYNTGVGGLTLFTVTSNATGNTAVGYGADLSSSSGMTNSTVIGYNAIVNANNKVRIGNTTVTVIEGQVAFSVSSDGRFKFNVKEDVKGLDFINKLRPITYQTDTKKIDEHHMKHMSDDVCKKRLEGVDHKDSTKIRHTGFIAQEVEQAAKDCGYNFDGVNKPQDENGTYGLSYSQFVVPIIKAIQELSSGTTQTKNSIFETQTILAEDNNIELNFSGTPETALGGGITVLHAMGKDKSAEIKTDTDGNWVTNNDFKPNALTIPIYTPSSSNDKNGSVGNITRSDDYLYVKDINGWKRTKLEEF